MTIALTGTPVLTTERLILRAPGPQDWPLWRDFIATDRARFVGGPVGPDKAWRAFGHVIGHWVLRGFGSFVFCARGGDRALGLTGPWFPEGWPEPEIGWTLWDSTREGQGYAAEAATAALGHAFRTLGWTTAVSYIAPDNTRSQALARRLGAVPEPQSPTPAGDPVIAWRHRGAAAWA